MKLLARLLLVLVVAFLWSWLFAVAMEMGGCYAAVAGG